MASTRDTRASTSPRSARTASSSIAICASSRGRRLTYSRRASGTLGCHEAQSHHARPVQAIRQRICGR